jgi:hypothetical protein
MIETLKTLFERDLNKLKLELELYQTESNIWIIEKNIANSAGNLCLHLIGNLNWFIGAEIGKTNYIRNRDLEFSQKNLPIQELLFKIDQTMEVVKNSLNDLKDSNLTKEYPILVFAQKTSTEFFLVHLATHLGYHLGQINYHRRLLD